nr:anaerobic sulfatase maturase [Blautia sp. AF34-10]
MKNISMMIKPVSGLCNMSCAYCFYCDEAQKREKSCYGQMSEETLKNVIRKTMLPADGVVSYTWQGGEPSLRGLEFFRRAVELQEKYNRNGVQVFNAFQTNGYAITEEWCEFFREKHFLIGLSVDGTQEIHDAFRCGADGGGTYDRVKRTADLFSRMGVEFNVLTVVTSQLAEHTKEIYESYRKNGWQFQQYIACLDPYGERKGERPYSLLPQQYGEFLSELAGLWYRDLKKGRQPYIRQFENYVGMAAGYQPESCEQCGICSEQYVVEADGSIYPCDFYVMDDWYMGNLNRDRLDAVDAKRLEKSFIGRSAPSVKCRECRFFSLCRGGCMRNRTKDRNGIYQNDSAKDTSSFSGNGTINLQNLDRR